MKSDTPVLIIIRGNSGSGKSTIAKSLRERMGERTMLVQQDVLRREVLFVKDRPGNPAIELIYTTASYGASIGYNVVLEGILKSDMYNDIISRLISDFNGRVLAYYLDVSFEETLRRHATKPNSAEYGEAKMKEWWQSHDVLGLGGETLIKEDRSIEGAVALILKDVSALQQTKGIKQ